MHKKEKSKYLYNIYRNFRSTGVLQSYNKNWTLPSNMHVEIVSLKSFRMKNIDTFLQSTAQYLTQL